MHLKMFLLFLFLLSQWEGAHAEHCHKLLSELASFQKDFVYCTTMNSAPVEFCNACKGGYENMTRTFEILTDDKNCSDKYFNKDRINIIATTQTILVGLWKKAYCDDCFVGNNSFAFDQKWSNLDLCLKNNTGKECIECLDDYLTLNDFYKSLDHNNMGIICYDIQDKMNRTRSYWSNTLHCCKRTYNMTIFVVVSAIIGLLPMGFYALAYVVNIRRERNHGVLSAGEFRTEDPSPAIVTPVTTAPREEPREPKFLKLQNEYSDSDSDGESTNTRKEC